LATPPKRRSRSEKTFYCDGHTDWARPCTVTSGNPSDKCLTTIQVYDFNTLDMISVTDSNNQTTTYNYDAAHRVTATTSPTGASGTAVYNIWGGKISSSATYNEGGTNKTLTTTVVYDGWGR
jgi:YD repeat-containing protein